MVVDVQEDFCPGGALPVTHGDGIVPEVNRWVGAFRKAGRPVAYTQDWHPRRHVSFSGRGGPWPPHCIQGSKGAQFHPDLRVEGTIFRKGFELDQEAYSGFQGRLSDPRGIEEVDPATWLRTQGVGQLFICGLAQDYCVKATALDALQNGFKATVISEATRPVEVNHGDGEKALKEIEAAGGSVLR